MSHSKPAGGAQLCVAVPWTLFHKVLWGRYEAWFCTEAPRDPATLRVETLQRVTATLFKNHPSSLMFHQKSEMGQKKSPHCELDVTGKRKGVYTTCNHNTPSCTVSWWEYWGPSCHFFDLWSQTKWQAEPINILSEIQPAPETFRQENKRCANRTEWDSGPPAGHWCATQHTVLSSRGRSQCSFMPSPHLKTERKFPWK